MIDRRDFLRKVGAAGLAPAVLGAAEASAPTGPESVGRALVLSGGGARGAYEAGIVWQISRSGGLADGERLVPYEFVCGTSIGALNGWFVATGQYSKLRNMWYTIADQDLIRLKPRFDKLTQQTAGLTNRIAAALRLLRLARDERGVAETEPVLDWMRREIDPRAPLLMPLVWAVTDLNSQQPEYFYRLPAGLVGPPGFILQSLHLTVGPHVVVREATDDLLHRALMASASVPFVFDPLDIPAGNGAVRSYVDGGVASNSPIGIARTVARSVDVVLLDPRQEAERLDNAVEVGLASFGTMQRKILEGEFQAAYFQSLVKRELERLSPGAVDKLAETSPVLKTFLHYLPVTEFAYLRPEKTLPVSVGGFDEQANINETFELGTTDIARGFAPYDWATFQY